MTLQALPVELNRLKNPPTQLFYKGNLELLKFPKVAIVGSRRASGYTKECVFCLAKMLNEAGVVVVSGGALGVDIEAHKGAMPNTIGVFGNGLNKIYPQTNAKTIKEIYENSLALSEYSPDTPSLPHHFLQRNRIVVGLSNAVVIAQADFQSGSMQSARMAKQMGIEIFVLPQRIGESDGTNALLVNAEAKLIDNFEKFVSKFSNDTTFKRSDKNVDEILEFCKIGIDLDIAIGKFGNKIYEYELLGLLQINGLRVISV